MSAKMLRNPRPALKRAREAVGLTQAQLADAAKCTTATISDLENGRNHQPSHEKVVHIFQALINFGMSGTTMDELFGVPKIAMNRLLPGRRRRRAS